MLAVRQSLVEQLDKTIAQLKRAAFRDQVIHEVRKDLKRARATLRLLRECIGIDAFQHEDKLIRDAARPLTALRDAKVLCEALRRLDSATGATKTSAFTRHLSGVLRKEQRSAKQQFRPEELKAAMVVLQGVKRRLEAVPELEDRTGALRPALERTYKSARRAFRRVQERPTDEGLHECRKQTKYLSSQLQILLPFGAKGLAKTYKRSRRMAEQLGEDHDLALLGAKIFQSAKGPNAASRNDAVEALITRLARRRKALQRKANRLGNRLYADKPRRIGAKIENSIRELAGH
jgi:CHAD domain-containing protein